MGKHYGLSKRETSTYKVSPRTRNPKLAAAEIVEHWNIRATRKDLQAVMSARHSLKENRAATKRLQMQILRFLGAELRQRSVFEVGCGIGRMTRILSREANSVECCDISAAMLQRAARNLRRRKNVVLHRGRIQELDLPRRSVDLAFACIVLQHILDRKELRQTAVAMRRLSRTIFICEHTVDDTESEVSQYTVLRTVMDYQRLFRPFVLQKRQQVKCAGDRLTLMLFRAKE